MIRAFATVIDSSIVKHLAELLLFDKNLDFATHSETTVHARG